MRKESWIVICQQLVGNPTDGYGISYEWDGERFATKVAAIKHGWEIRESDDFNVCSLKGNKLTGFYWMEKDMDDPEGMAEICKQHSFTRALSPAQSGLT
jgi:hypothetical protein